MSAVTHIRRDEAHRVHASLVDALGTETNPAQWMTFMARVRQELPEVLSRGRPSKSAIDASPIGALGFSTWRAMCEAPVSDGGLGLLWSTWRQWSRAWATVQQHPALEETPLTAAEVNRIAQEAKNADEPMPGDRDAVQAFRERQETRKADARAESHVAMKNRLEALQGDLEVARTEGEHSNGIITELRRQLAEAESQLEDEKRQRDHAQWRMAQLEAQCSNADERLQTLQEELFRYQNGSILQRLKGFFSKR